MKKSKFQRPTGMDDILPEDQIYYQKIYEVVSNIADFYGFLKIDTPIVEEEELFSRGVGLGTDIVKKEMYSFKTKSGDRLALRPEWTSSVMRAYIENGMHNLPQPVKLWYFGPCYRYERPQYARRRQFWQFGFEVIGEKNPIIDAQIIQIFYNILLELKLKNLTVEINSIGDNNCRPYYKKLLKKYFTKKASSLCVNCKRRLKENILRIFDCKEERCQGIKTDAPQILDYLCEDCRKHLKSVLEFLDEVEIPYNLDSCLVRGLDYYTRTVFEIFSVNKKETDTDKDKKENNKKDNKNNNNEKEDFKKDDKEENLKSLALVGGGRYDKLSKMLGGKDTPACGGAAGVERIIDLMKIEKVKVLQEKKIEVFLAQLGDLAKKKSLKILEDFRKAKIRVGEVFGRDSLRSQLNRADRLGVKYALILGQKEALEGVIIVRNMEDGTQETVKIDKVVSEVKKRLRVNRG